MVNSFIRYSPYSTSNYEKKYDKKISYYYMIFVFF